MLNRRLCCGSKQAASASYEGLQQTQGPLHRCSLLSPFIELADADHHVILPLSDQTGSALHALFSHLTEAAQAMPGHGFASSRLAPLPWPAQ